MGVVTYTHSWSWFCRILQVLVQAIVVGVLCFAYGLIVEATKIKIPDDLNGIVMVAFVVAAFLLISFGCVGPFFHVLATHLYLTRTLKADTTWADAEKIAWAFSPNDSGKWYPMLEIRDAPRNARRDLILSNIENLVLEKSNGSALPVLSKKQKSIKGQKK